MAKQIAQGYLHKSNSGVKSLVDTGCPVEADATDTSASAVKIAFDFAPWNENSTDSRKFAKHFPTHEAAHRFFANT